MLDNLSGAWVRPGNGVVRSLVFIALAGLNGCGQDSKFGSVHGVVRLDGTPLTKGTVRFVPDAGRAAVGEIQSDGTFTLGTYHESDGAFIGTHRVAIIAYETATLATPGSSRPADVTAVNPNVKPLVPERYMAIGTSKLTFEVKPGANQADFNLTKK
jgi:hypothetical protein